MTRALLLVLLCALNVSAQESRAMLLGVVTDATGAVAPGTELTATNTETEVRYSAEANAEGNYVIPYLPPGAYRLRAEQPGFRTAERGPVALRTGDRIRIDVILEVGRVAENVTVVADTPPLESTNASLGLVIDARRVAELPIAHGNVYHLTQLVAGVALRRQRHARPALRPEPHRELRHGRRLRAAQRDHARRRPQLLLHRRT